MILRKFKVAILVVLVLIIGCRKEPELELPQVENVEKPKASNMMARSSIKVSAEQLSNLFCSADFPYADTKYDLEFEEVIKITDLIDAITYYSHQNKNKKDLQIRAEYVTQGIDDKNTIFYINLDQKKQQEPFIDQLIEGDFVKVKAKIAPNFANNNSVSTRDDICYFNLQNPVISELDASDIANYENKIMQRIEQFLERNNYQNTPQQICFEIRDIHYKNNSQRHYGEYGLNKAQWIQVTSFIKTKNIEKFQYKIININDTNALNIISKNVDGDSKIYLKSIIRDEKFVTKMFDHLKQGQKISSKGILKQVNIDEYNNCFIVLYNPQTQIIKTDD